MSLPFLNKVFIAIISLTMFPQISAVAAPEKRDTVPKITSYHQSWLTVPDIANRQSFTVDRGEACKFLIEAYTKMTGKTPPNAAKIANPFKDVNAGQLPHVLQAQSLGFISIPEDGLFHPTDEVSKADLAVMFYTLIHKVYPNVKDDGIEKIEFPDEVPEYALKPLKFMFSRGIFNKPASGTIEAYSNINLGEISTMVNKLVFTAPEYAPISDGFEKRHAYLTFDDGTSANTSVILDTLKLYNVKATFFVTGQSDPELLQRIKKEGHTLANHTMSHNYKKIYASSDDFWTDFNAEQEYLLQTVGDISMFLRFPGGSNNSIGMRNGVMGILTAEAKEKGYVYFDWNVDSGDATGNTIPKDTIVNNVLRGASGKTEAVILMHQTGPKTTTAQALPEIIVKLRAMGFELSSLNNSSYSPRFVK